MRVKTLLYIIRALPCLVVLLACDEEEAKDRVETISMFVSEQTGTYRPWGSEESIECMLVKEGKDGEQFSLGFFGISGFEYERGYTYELSVEKTTLANPPMDAENVRYKLLEILKKEVAGDFFSVEMRYGIDAEQRELIEADLRDHSPVPERGGYVLVNQPVIFVVDANRRVVERAEFTMNFPEGKTFPDSYRLVVPDNQIITQNEWQLVFKDRTIRYDVTYEKYGIQIQLVTRPWLYQDLTEHYKQKYPDAGVRGVVCVQVLTWTR